MEITHIDHHPEQMIGYPKRNMVQFESEKPILTGNA
jgi:hypothetical protein